MPPNPPSNSRLPRLAVWSGYGTVVPGEKSPYRLYIFSKYNPLNKDTPFTPTLFMAPSGSVLTGFNCMFIVRVLLLTCVILPSSWLLHSRETRSKQYLLQTVEIRLSSSIMIS